MNDILCKYKYLYVMVISFWTVFFKVVLGHIGPCHSSCVSCSGPMCGFAPLKFQLLVLRFYLYVLLSTKPEVLMISLFSPVGYMPGRLGSSGIAGAPGSSQETKTGNHKISSSVWWMKSYIQKLFLMFDLVWHLIAV